MARTTEVPAPTDASLAALRRIITQFNQQIRALQQQVDELRAQVRNG